MMKACLQHARCLSVGLGIASLAGCAAALSWAPLDLEALPGAEAHPDAPGVVLLDEETVRFHEVDGRAVADSSIRYRVKILRHDGRDLGDMAVHYDRLFQSVLQADVRVTFPDGKTRDYTADELDDVMAGGSGVLYQDNRALVKSHDALPIGSVVEYAFTTRHSQPELFQFAFYFTNGEAPTTLARFEVIAPVGWKTEQHASRYWQPIDLPPTDETAVEGEVHTVWQMRDIPGDEREPFAPTSRDRAQRVAARLAAWTIGGQAHKAPESMQGLSKYLAELEASTAEPTPQIEAKTQALLAGAPDDPNEKARLLYEWVQSKIRYVAIEIGLGGWRPYTAEAVFKTEYGDCKDKATLLKSMLKVAGIDSHLASLYSHDGFPRTFTLPTLGNANHAILGIELPGGIVFADPTERTVPFGELPLRDQSAQILMSKLEGALPLTTPASSANDNTKTVRMNLRLGEDDSASGDFELHLTGSFAAEFEWDVIAETDAEQRQNAEGWLWIERGSVAGVRHDRSREGRFTVVSTGTVTVPRLVGRSGPTRLLRLSDFIGTPGVVLPPVQSRRSPIVFSKRVQRRLELRVELPPGLEVRRVPEPVSIDAEVGSYRLSWATEGTALRATESYRLTQRIVPPQKYEALRSFFHEIQRATRRGLLIKPAGGGGA